MITGMDAAQRAHDRQEPMFNDDEEKVHSSRLSGNDVLVLTNHFIDELAEADFNRMEELLGDSPSDLELIYQQLAKNWLAYDTWIDRHTNGFFWDKCKKMALSAYDNGYLDL